MAENADNHRSPSETLDDLARKTPKKERATVRCGTSVGEGSQGEFTMEFIREWSPFGYDKAVLLFEEVGILKKLGADGWNE
jgi:hypothetical protein